MKWMKIILFLIVMTTMGCEKDAETGYASVNGIEMYYEVHGQGPPLVLVHGAGSTIETTFGRIIPELQKYRKVIAVELQAHGRTGDRDTPISFEQDADDVAALVRQLGISKADFFGFSNGGNTVLQVAIRHPELCERVVAASVLLKRDGTFPQFWEFMKQGTFKDMPIQYKDAFMKVTPDSARLHTMFRKCADRMIGFQDFPDEALSSIKCPVLLVNGDKDVATSEHVVEMSRLITGSSLAILPGGHGEYMGEIVALKSPEGDFSVLPVLRDFLQLR